MSQTDTLDTIQSSLVNAGVGQKTNSATDWMIYKGMMQDSAPGATTPLAVADRAICLYETGGRPPLERWAIDYPGIQVVVRGQPDDYTAVRKKIQDIFNQLHANEGDLSADFVYLYATQSGPLMMGIDEKRRPRLGWNFRIMRNRVTA